MVGMVDTSSLSERTTTARAGIVVSMLNSNASYLSTSWPSSEEDENFIRLHALKFFKSSYNSDS